MLLKNEPLENRQVLLTIRVDKEDWQRALQELYNDCSSLYPVEGCAPGKATREQLEAAYGKDFLYQDAVNHTFPEALVEAVAEANLQVAAAPDLSIVDIGPGGYIFTALVQLYPEVKLGQYKGLSAPMDPAELTERDGDEAVARWQQEHLHEEHPERAAMGDEVVLDFEGFVDGIAFERYFREALHESAIPVPGAHELLEQLHGRFLLCAASNGPYAQQVHRLELSDMRKYFDYLFISEKIGVSKPSRAFYDAAFAELNAGRAEPIRPCETLMLGDSPTSDMAGGLQYGMRTCFFRRHPDKPAPAGVDTVAADLPQALREILALAER